MLSAITAATTAALLLSGCHGCRGGHQTATTTTTSASDASTADAAAKTTALGPWTATLAARSLGPVVLVRMDDDELVVRGGVYVHSISRGGALERLGAPADYIPLLPEGDDEIGGYEARSLSIGSAVIHGTSTRPFLRLLQNTGADALGPRETVVWNGTSWVKTTEEPPPARLWRFSPSSSSADAGTAAPEPKPPTDIPGAAFTNREISKRGTIVWLGRGTNFQAMDQTAVVAPHGKPRLIPIPHPDPDAEVGAAGAAAAAAAAAAQITKTKNAPVPEVDAPGYRRSHPLRCSLLDDALDGEIYLTCGRIQGDESVYRLDGDADKEHWTRIWLGAEREWRKGGYVVDKEGALWLWEGHDDDARIVRLKAHEEEQRFVLPVTPPSATTPTYRAYSEMILATPSSAAAAHPDTADNFRSWMTTTIYAGPAATPLKYVSLLKPRLSGDVMALAHDASGGTSIIRVARTSPSPAAAPTPAPVLIRSDVDEQNEVRNARGARRWVGHCAAVFVPFPKQADERPIDDFVATHNVAIQKAIALMDKPSAKQKKEGISVGRRADVAIVEGTFTGKQRVAGMLFLRSYPEVDEDVMEASASRVAEIVTMNPASPPEVMCAAPTLERIVTDMKP